jgi:cytochrome c oxidase cbb3-type subunit III
MAAKDGLINYVCPLALFPCVLLAQHGYTPGDIEEGQRLFSTNCAVCHGAEGDGVPGVDLGHGKFRRAVADIDVIDIIQKGIPGTAMPPNNFDDIKAGAIVAYLRSIASFVGDTASIPGDARHGKAIFEGRGNCMACHRVNGRGSRLGPELTDIGMFRRAAQLKQSIVDPDAEILPQNRFMHVVTKEGTVLDGRLLNHDTYTLQLFDSKERLLTFQKSALKEYKFVETSPMPSYKEKLSDQEIADVVNYLVSLRGVEAK